MNSFDNVVNADPTLKFFIRDAKLDEENFDFQISLICSALKLALARWIDIQA